jgi:hypothetical protein
MKKGRDGTGRDRNWWWWEFSRTQAHHTESCPSVALPPLSLSFCLVAARPLLSAAADARAPLATLRGRAPRQIPGSARRRLRSTHARAGLLRWSLCRPILLRCFCPQKLFQNSNEFLCKRQRFNSSKNMRRNEIMRRMRIRPDITAYASWSNRLRSVWLRPAQETWI